MPTEILAALLAPLRGFVLLLRTPALWLYALPPLVLGVAWAALFVAQRYALPALPTDGGFVASALGATLELLLGAFVLLIQVLIALSAPLLDWLGEQTEEALGVLPTGPGFLRELLTLRWLRRGYRALLEAIKLLGVKLAILALALPLGFIPEVGPALSFLLSGISTGLDFIDYPLARREYRLTEKLAWARAHWAAVLSFGVAVFALLAWPVLAALLLPACVVGGTDLVFRLGGVTGEAQVRGDA